MRRRSASRRSLVSTDASPALFLAEQAKDRAALHDHDVRAFLADGRRAMHAAPGLVGAALERAIVGRAKIRQHARAGRRPMLAVLGRRPADCPTISLAAPSD